MPYVSQIIFGDQIKMDLTNDTVTPEHVEEGYTFHAANGDPCIGNMQPGGNVPVPDNYKIYLKPCEIKEYTDINARVPNSNVLFGVLIGSNNSYYNTWSGIIENTICDYLYIYNNNGAPYIYVTKQFNIGGIDTTSKNNYIINNNCIGNILFNNNILTNGLSMPTFFIQNLYNNAMHVFGDGRCLSMNDGDYFNNIYFGTSVNNIEGLFENCFIFEHNFKKKSSFFNPYYDTCFDYINNIPIINNINSLYKTFYNVYDSYAIDVFNIDNGSNFITNFRKIPNSITNIDYFLKLLQPSMSTYPEYHYTYRTSTYNYKNYQNNYYYKYFNLYSILHSSISSLENINGLFSDYYIDGYYSTQDISLYINFSDISSNIESLHDVFSNMNIRYNYYHTLYIKGLENTNVKDFSNFFSNINSSKYNVVYVSFLCDLPECAEDISYLFSPISNNIFVRSYFRSGFDGFVNTSNLISINGLFSNLNFSVNDGTYRNNMTLMFNNSLPNVKYASHLFEDCFLIGGSTLFNTKVLFKQGGPNNVEDLSYMFHNSHIDNYTLMNRVLTFNTYWSNITTIFRNVINLHKAFSNINCNNVGQTGSILIFNHGQYWGGNYNNYKFNLPNSGKLKDASYMFYNTRLDLNMIQAGSNSRDYINFTLNDSVENCAHMFDNCGGNVFKFFPVKRVGSYDVIQMKLPNNCIDCGYMFRGSLGVIGITNNGTTTTANVEFIIPNGVKNISKFLSDTMKWSSVLHIFNSIYIPESVENVDYLFDGINIYSYNILNSSVGTFRIPGNVKSINHLFNNVFLYGSLANKCYVIFNEGIEYIDRCMGINHCTGYKMIIPKTLKKPFIFPDMGTNFNFIDSTNNYHYNIYLNGSLDTYKLNYRVLDLVSSTTTITNFHLNIFLYANEMDNFNNLRNDGYHFLYDDIQGNNLFNDYYKFSTLNNYLFSSSGNYYYDPNYSSVFRIYFNRDDYNFDSY